MASKKGLRSTGRCMTYCLRRLIELTIWQPIGQLIAHKEAENGAQPTGAQSIYITSHGTQWYCGLGYCTIKWYHPSIIIM